MTTATINCPTLPFKGMANFFSNWQWPDDETKVCIGVDEAGRGALAGEIFVAAVLIRRTTCLPSGIKDSKMLSAKKRHNFFEKICAMSDAYSIASACVEEIERLNPLGATMLAMQRAVSAFEHYCFKTTRVLIDGNCAPDLPFAVTAIIKGDQCVPCIACASILAKESRDRKMRDWSQRYAAYGFERHKGYGVQKHLNALAIHGPSPIHRKTFQPVKQYC